MEHKASPLPPAPLATSQSTGDLQIEGIARNRKIGFQDSNQWIKMKSINLFAIYLITGLC